MSSTRWGPGHSGVAGLIPSNQPEMRREGKGRIQKKSQNNSQISGWDAWWTIFSDSEASNTGQGGLERWAQGRMRRA